MVTWLHNAQTTNIPYHLRRKLYKHQTRWKHGTQR